MKNMINLGNDFPVTNVSSNIIKYVQLTPNYNDVRIRTNSYHSILILDTIISGTTSPNLMHSFLLERSCVTLHNGCMISVYLTVYYQNN